MQAPPGQQMRRLNFSNTYGKTSTKTRQQLWVIHTGETPLDHGYAASLTRWAAKKGDPYVSWHRFVDPSLVVTWIPLNRGAWHATWANGISIGYEQSGYARFSSEWLTPKGLAQIDLLAQQIVADGIPKEAVRWLTSAEVLKVRGGNRTIKGLCTHAQINPENRTDPGKGYAYDLLLYWIKWYHPDFPEGPGEGDILDMDEKELRAIIREEVANAVIPLTDNQRDNIYGNHDTSPSAWRLSKALAYISGHVALIRGRQSDHRAENSKQAAAILGAVGGDTTKARVALPEDADEE
jgi:hypothetical protein